MNHKNMGDMLFSGGSKGQCGVSNTVVVSANNRRKMLFMPQKKKKKEFL